MKILTCKELGGECDARLSAETWKEIVGKMVDHVVTHHSETAKEMEKMHNEDPEKWGKEHKPLWEAAPEMQ